MPKRILCSLRKEQSLWLAFSRNPDFKPHLGAKLFIKSVLNPDLCT